jgi:hypothetical protein
MRVSKEKVSAAFFEAGQQIKDAAGRDRKTTRSELEAQTAELPAPQRALASSFFEIVTHRQQGLPVNASAVDRAVAYAAKHLVGAYDLNDNGLSASEIAQMSETGKLAVDVAQATQPSRPHLKLAAERFVVENSGRAKLYPDATEGNNGTFGFLVEDERAAKVVACINSLVRDPAAQLQFDPETQNLIVVRNSEDDIGLYLAVQDKQTGAVKPWGQDLAPFTLVDIDSELDEATRTELFPETAGEEYPDSFVFLVEGVLEKGTHLDIGNQEER